MAPNYMTKLMGFLIMSEEEIAIRKDERIKCAEKIRSLAKWYKYINRKTESYAINNAANYILKEEETHGNYF